MVLNEKNGKVEWTFFGIVSGDGENIFFLDDAGTGVDIYPRITEEEAADLGWCSWVHILHYSVGGVVGKIRDFLKEI